MRPIQNKPPHVRVIFANDTGAADQVGSISIATNIWKSRTSVCRSGFMQLK
jgi:hypothetical protein